MDGGEGGLIKLVIFCGRHKLMTTDTDNLCATQQKKYTFYQKNRGKVRGIEKCEVLISTSRETMVTCLIL